MSELTAQTVTIASGQTVSNEFQVPNEITLLRIMAPATLPETVNLKMAPTSGGTSRIVQDGTVDVVVAAGRCVQLPVGGGYYTLVATGAVGGSRAFTVDFGR